MTSIQGLMCRKIGHEYVKISDISLQCGEKSFQNYFNIAILILVMIIIPYSILKSLKKAHRKKFINKNIFFKRKYGIMYLEYKSNMYYWEFVSLA